jgi:GNAT superfamily N-acetyltransferase
VSFPAQATVTFHALEPERFPDLEALFGPRGACGGCWCMNWRRTARAYEASKGAGNRDALRALAEAGRPLGVLAYQDEEPVGWCAVAPRGDFVRLAGSRILAPVDGVPVWSIVCLFVKPTHRRAGLSVGLLREACAYAAARGAPAVEAYPVEPANGTVPDVFASNGVRSAFDRAGFREVARRAPTRPIMRWWPNGS